MTYVRIRTMYLPGVDHADILWLDEPDPQRQRTLPPERRRRANPAPKPPLRHKHRHKPPYSKKRLKRARRERQVHYDRMAAVRKLDAAPLSRTIA